MHAHEPEPLRERATTTLSAPSTSPRPTSGPANSITLEEAPGEVQEFRLPGRNREVRTFVLAKVHSSWSCPAHPSYVETEFRTPVGSWRWCFPGPGRASSASSALVALVLWPHGIQVHRALNGLLGYGLSPMADLLRSEMQPSGD